MKNSFVANAVNAAVQTVLGQCSTLGISFNIYSQKNLSCENVDEKTKEHTAYPRLKRAADFLYSFRHYCKLKNYNEYQAGYHLVDNYFLDPYPEEMAASAYECTVLAIYVALESGRLNQVNRALVIIDRGDSASKRVLHEFVIIGEITGDEICVEFPMGEVGSYVAKNLLYQSEPPWAVDAAFNLACPLAQYPHMLGQAVSSAAGGAALNQSGMGTPDTKTAQKSHVLYQIGPEITPMAFYALVSGGNVLTVEVTRQSKRLDISENDGVLNYNDFF